MAGKFKITVRVGRDQEESFRGYMMKEWPDDKPEETQRCLKIALGNEGLDITCKTREGQIERADSLRTAGFTNLELDPPEDPPKEQPLKSETEASEETLPIDDVLITPLPTADDVLVTPPPVEKVTQEEIDFLLETSKPEMVEITLDSFSTEAKIADAMAVLEPFVDKDQTVKIMLFLSGQEGAEQPTISVPKGKVYELCEKLVAAGIVTKVPGPIEEEVVASSSVSKKELEDILKQLADLGAKLEELKARKQTEPTNISPVLDEIAKLTQKIGYSFTWLIGGEKEGKFEAGIILKRFEEIKMQIAGIKIPEAKDVDLTSVITELKTAIGEIEIPVPEMPDMADLKEKISETQKGVEELILEIKGGTDESGNEVVSLKSRIVRSAQATRKAFSAAVVAALILCGFLLGAVTYAVVLHFAPPKISAKIDQTEITGTVKSAVTSALDTKINATVDIDTFVQELLKNEEFKKFLTPAVNAKVPGEPGGGITAPRTGKH